MNPEGLLLDVDEQTVSNIRDQVPNLWETLSLFYFRPLMVWVLSYVMIYKIVDGSKVSKDANSR